MALVYCRECGHQISEHAQSCPSCGAPSQPHVAKKNKKNTLIGIVLLIIAISGYLYYTSQSAEIASETRQDRIDVADRLLSKDCGTLTNMSTEYVKNDLAASIMNGLGNLKCDCLKEKLREKLADKYTLTELQDFDKKPIHEVLEIKNLIEENNEELKSCFPLINKVKDAAFKK